MADWIPILFVAILFAGALLVTVLYGFISIIDIRQRQSIVFKRVIPRPIPLELRAESLTKCSICLGVIRKDLASTECSCGSSFHHSCAIKVGLCPLCQQEIEIAELPDSLFEHDKTPVRSMPLIRDDRLFLLEDRFLLGELEFESYQALKAEIIATSPDAVYCEECGLRLYPGEECTCTLDRLIRCPECARELSRTDSYCSSCGVVLSEDFSDELYQCTACGQIVQSSKRICSCGAVLLDPGETICGDCGHPVPVEAEACMQCGRVKFTEVLECPLCEREVSPTDFECECGVIFVDRIERIECPECGDEIFINDKYCRSCGVGFKADSFSSYIG